MYIQIQSAQSLNKFCITFISGLEYATAVLRVYECDIIVKNRSVICIYIANNPVKILI